MIVKFVIKKVNKAIQNWDRHLARVWDGFFRNRKATLGQDPVSIINDTWPESSIQQPSHQGRDGGYNKLTNGFIFFPIQARSQQRNIEYFKTQLWLTN